MFLEVQVADATASNQILSRRVDDLELRSPINRGSMRSRASMEEMTALVESHEKLKVEFEALQAKQSASQKEMQRYKSKSGM